MTAKRAPEPPAGGGVGGHSARTYRRLYGPRYHPSGPVGSLLDPPCTWVLGIAASWPIRARYHLIYYKVSQNAEVSPKYVEKAYHSPCFTFSVQKSPLDFLGFPFSTAFSHKELMGRFGPYYGLYCQNDEVSPVCTRTCTRERVVRYPHRSRSKLLLGPAPHLTQREQYGDILNKPVSIRKLGTLRPWAS